jgi:outer membrane lipoprotein-sorting protein
MTRRTIVLAILLAPFAARADALDDHLGERLRAATAARAKLKTLSGPFKQERTIGLLSSKVVSTGKIALVRPDRLLWELDAPDSISYWVGPEGLAYKGKQGQGRMPLGTKAAPALDDLRTLLAGDLSKLRDHYDLTEVPSSGLAFEAVPKKKEDARFQKIIFELQSDQVRPKKVTLIESARDKTDITFGDLTIDATIDPARVRPPF